MIEACHYVRNWRKVAEPSRLMVGRNCHCRLHPVVRNVDVLTYYPNNRSSRATKNASTLSGATSSSVAGDHFGFRSLSMIAARMPS